MTTDVHRHHAELLRVIRTEPFEPVFIALRDGRVFRIESRGEIELACDRSVVLLFGEAVAIREIAAIGPVVPRPPLRGEPLFALDDRELVELYYGLGAHVAAETDGVKRVRLVEERAEVLAELNFRRTGKG